MPGPDPFTEDERDSLLEYFRLKRWRLGRYGGGYDKDSYFPYYAFLFTLFYTGLRPSEAVALRHRSLHLAHATSSSSVHARSARKLLPRRQRQQGWCASRRATSNCWHS
ncbi:MAG: hypothetical protein JO071_05325 [Deltaproteobacteria bacterium]|nr:hypothetical protein [Deltaproteobacteria bacterium]